MKNATGHSNGILQTRSIVKFGAPWLELRLVTPSRRVHGVAVDGVAVDGVAVDGAAGRLGRGEIGPLTFCRAGLGTQPNWGVSLS